MYEYAVTEDEYVLLDEIRKYQRKAVKMAEAAQKQKF